MNRSSVSLLRAMIAIAVIALVSLMTHSLALAQPGTPYDIKVMTPAEGAAGEYGLNYTVDFNGTQGPVPGQNLSLSGEGKTSYTLPANATSIRSITANGITYLPGQAAAIFIPWAGGCWRLCFRWLWPQFWPWYPRYYIFWYWDPCCQ